MSSLILLSPSSLLSISDGDTPEVKMGVRMARTGGWYKVARESGVRALVLNPPFPLAPFRGKSMMEVKGWDT